MATPPDGKRPTEAELAILGVLWERGPSTVREVHAALDADEGRAYTTVLKLMQIMADKGLVTRSRSARQHVYAPAKEAQETQRAIVGDLLERAFHGSTASLVQAALSSRPASQDEFDEIRRLLDELEDDA